jgi:hypothetical protein
MTREERDLAGLLVSGSDHLTAYNVYAEAYRLHGSVGEVYGLPRHVFAPELEEWAERRGVLVKAIEDAALAVASIYRSVGLPLPSQLVLARDATYKKLADLIARYMPFDLVIDEETADGQSARVSRSSVAGSWGAIAGTIRYFADRFGVSRAAIEGTQIPMDVIRRYALRLAPEVVYDRVLKVRRRLEYFGFELDRESEPIDVFPPDLADAARDALADALASGEARHHAVRRDSAAIHEIRAAYRRSGGRTPRLSEADLAALYRLPLAQVSSFTEFRSAPLPIDLNAVLSPDARHAYDHLPSETMIRGQSVPIEYDVQDSKGIARLRLPAKLARTLTEAEVPALDRPVRFTVLRGQQSAVHADSLDQLQDLLAEPWEPTRERPKHHSKHAKHSKHSGQSNRHPKRRRRR